MSFKISLHEQTARPGQKPQSVERYRQVVDEIGTLEFAAAIEDAVRATRKRIEREAAKGARKSVGGGA